MAAETRSSWWDRNPWTGAILFAVVVSAVGAFLAAMVGERPHMRGAWSLVTEYRRGAYEQGAPWSEDPVRVVVRVRVHDEDYRGVVGAQVSLVTADLRTVSRGFTGPPEGHIHLPVPERFSKTLFEGSMRVHVFQPGRSPAVAEIPLPKEGLSTLQVPVENVRSVRVHVERPDGKPVRKRGGVVAAPVGLRPHPGARPWPINAGVAVIGGLPDDLPVHLEATVSGHAPTTTTVDASTTSVTMNAGVELARLNVVVHDEAGKPQTNRRLRVRVIDGDAASPVTTIKTDGKGVLKASIRPGKDRRVVLRDGARRTGAILVAGELAPGQKWRPNTVVLRPYPLLVSGTVTIGGEKAPSALVTVRPWARGGGAETSTTGDDGRFEVRGLDTGEPILVTAFKSGRVGRSEAVQPGTSGVTVAAGPPGTVKGRLKTRPEVIRSGVLVGALPVGARDRGAALQATHAERDGSFTLESLPAGTYDIVAWAEGSEPRVIPNVVVAAGTTTDDGRLDAFEL